VYLGPRTTLLVFERKAMVLHKCAENGRFVGFNKRSNRRIVVRDTQHGRILLATDGL
jgi:ribosomal protein L34E